MKNLIALSFVLFSILSCQKEPITPPVEEPTTGRIRFEVHLDSEPLANAYVGISKDNPADEENLFLIIKPTNENGEVIFDNLEPGEYFYKVKSNDFPDYIGNTDFVDFLLGGIEVRAGGKHGVPLYID